VRHPLGEETALNKIVAFLWKNAAACIHCLPGPEWENPVSKQELFIYLIEKIMLKKLSMVGLLFITAIAAKADEGQKVSSKVQKVVVFLNGAQVTRTAMVSVNAGTSQLIFGGISPGIDVQSIQVHAGGEFTILSVKQELDFINEQVKQKQVEELQAQQKMIKDKITLQNNMLAIYQEEETMLEKNQLVTGDNASLDIVKLKQALDFHTERLTEIKKNEQAASDEAARLMLELQKYDKQIADIVKGNTTATSNILVTISSKSALQSEFTISYVVHNASWYPSYDIRAKDISSPISISYKANVSQQSGEDWKNVKLTLSTGNPTVSGDKPELGRYYLNFGMIYSNQADRITNVTGTIIAKDDGLPIPGVSVRIKGTSIGTQTGTNGNYSLQIPNGPQILVFSFIGYSTEEDVVSSPVLNVIMKVSAQQLGEVVVTGALGIKRQARQLGFATANISGAALNNEVPNSYSGSSSGGGSVYPSAPAPVKLEKQSLIPIVVPSQNQTNVEFNIADPYSVPSDGKQYTVEINQLDLSASYEYAVAPKLSTDVFLTAKLTDWNKYNFLSGEANLFFEGTFIGKSLLNTEATKDTLNISLGTDKNIVVTRTPIKDLTQKQTFGSNIKETRDWQIEVKNRKNQSVNLLIEDQVPVSQNSSIEVETQELSAGNSNHTTGKVSWNLSLNPLDDKKIELIYLVKYPKNQTVIVE
jgi:hypothetical protein